ncbi:PD40 domain-containing protein [Microbacterium kyungheense]|nr:PD40 domain-containing protein [Microbacterium kyungheense]
MAVLTIPTLIVTGLATLTSTAASALPVAAAVGLPTGAERFAVADGAGGGATDPFLTPDGQQVVFASSGADPAGGDNGLADIYRSTATMYSDDPFSGAPDLVSVPDGPVGTTRADGASAEPVASADGRYVAFTSAATNLTGDASTAPGRTYVYVRDTLRDHTFRIQAAAEPDGDSFEPDLSDDGRHLVFTSTAGNLVTAGPTTVADTNGVADTYVADLDADGDGIYGDIALRKAFPSLELPTGSSGAVISGNGDVIALLSRSDPISAQPATALPSLYTVDRGFTVNRARLIATAASALSIDATGTNMAYIRSDACKNFSGEMKDVVVATTVEGNVTGYSVGLGTIDADRRVGEVADPQISPQGSDVAWSTTVPLLVGLPSGVDPVALAVPVIRTQEINWSDAQSGTIECVATFSPDWIDVAEGTHPSVSVAGRTLAFQSPSPSEVAVVDTHTSSYLSVESVDGWIPTPGYMTQVRIQNIPLTTLRDYAAQLAGAPVYRLPVYRLPVYRLPVYRLPVYRLLIDDSPVYRLPVYRLPVYRLPVYRLDLPGGWDQILADTPFAGELTQTVTLDEVLGWAAGILDDGNPATDAERAAAELIRSLTLQDLGLDESGLAGLSLTSYALGSAPVAQIPIAGEGTEPIARWQALLTAQGIDLTLDDDAVLAELDSAGLTLDTSGIDAVPLRDLPIALTLLSEVPADRLFLADTPLGAVDVTTLSPESRTALFGTTEVTGTLAAPSTALLSTGTAADIAAGAPQDVTVGTLLFSLLDAESYPWEDIAPSAIDPRYASARSVGNACTPDVRCRYWTGYRFAFDLGPGESQVGPGDDPLTIAAPTAFVDAPASTVPTDVYAAGSGPGIRWGTDDGVYSGPLIRSGQRVTAPLADMRAGTVFALGTFFSWARTMTDFGADGGITSGIYAASAANTDVRTDDAWDEPATNYENGEWVGVPTELTEGSIFYGWIAPDHFLFDEETGTESQSPSSDEDYYLVDPAPRGKRLVISTNAQDGQIAISLFRPSGSASAATLGVADAGTAPGTAVTEQSDFGAIAESGSDAAGALPGQTLVDQAVVRDGIAAEIEAAGVDTAPGEQLMVRVTSGNGMPSSSLYSLRVRYVDDSDETRCPGVDAPDMGEPGQSDPVTATTNTLYIFDATRYAQEYGWEGSDAVREALASMNGVGAAGSEVDGAILSVDSDPAVRAARTAYNQNPCSLSARAALTTAINRYVAAAVDGHRDQITSVVVVGGDDIVPFAPVAQNTAQFTESSHATDLRRATTPTGEPCPVDIAPDAVDPCATPLSAAAAAGDILTDDPYGLATAYESLAGHLYVPTVGLGRLVETPAQIQGIAARFRAADGAMDAAGELAADSSVTAGYGAWAELPAEVTAALEWRSPANTELTGTWTQQDMSDALFPADGAESPRLVSLNTHADERRMLPGVDGAESGRFAETDLFLADGRGDQSQLAGALVFLIGCHAGNNLPTAYFGDVEDWVDVFSTAGGFVGNTGYGLANNTTTALGERLLALYADWIGVTVDGRSITSAQALAYAKQSYLGGLGLYSGYDEKVLMGAVYYGLPMYTFSPAASGETKSAPLPEVPAGLSEVADHDGVLSASLRLQPTFQSVPSGSADGTTYLTADGQAPAVVPGQPVLPRLAAALGPRPEDPPLVPRGALITALTSEVETGVSPAIAAAGVGVPQTELTRAGVAFPSTFATISQQDAPGGPVDLLVVTPARVEVARDGTASIEKFTDLNVEAVYGPADSTDSTAPSVTYVEVPGAGGSRLSFGADGTGSDIAQMVLLVQRDGQAAWERVPVTRSPSGTSWDADVPNDGRPFRWILQVVDAAGNVATQTQHGHLDLAAAAAPALGAPGDDATVEAGSRLERTIAVTDAAPGEDLTATVYVRSGKDVVASGPAAIEQDGAQTHARIDELFPTPGGYVVEVRVCRTASCSTASFAVEVVDANLAPAATVTLEPDGSDVTPTSLLTADADGTDPDGDHVDLSYRWTRNGTPVGADATTLALDGLAHEGDVITVTVMPNDGTTDGHAASASVVVQAPSTAPQIVATAVNAAGPYTEGTWSTTPVTVTFQCTSGVAITSCPTPVTVDADTAPEGRTVSGTVTDVRGETATTELLVKVDGTAPALAPVVTPDPVTVGGTATATPNATDAASGVASQSCDVPSTATAGTASVTCRATDAAGNTGSASAAYTVTAPGPVLCGGVPDRSPLLAVNADGSSVFFRLSGVPIVFRACDAAGKSIGTKRFVTGVVLVATADLPSSAKVNEGLYPPIGSFTYAKLTKTWVGAIPTIKLKSGKKYTYRIELADGTSFTVTFGVR